MIAFEFSKSVKSIRKLSRSKIKLMFHFLKNIHYETQTEGKTIKTHFLVMRSLEAGQPDGEWRPWRNNILEAPVSRYHSKVWDATGFSAQLPFGRRGCGTCVFARSPRDQFFQYIVTLNLQRSAVQPSERLASLGRIYVGELFIIPTICRRFASHNSGTYQ